MKKIDKLFLVFATLFFSQIAFAAKDNVIVDVNFINNTVSLGNPFIYDKNFVVVAGPSLPKNGGSVQWDPSLGDSLYGLGIGYPNGVQNVCYQGSEAMVLNPELYKGDTINVTFSLDNTGNLVCICSGSACDISAAKH